MSCRRVVEFPDDHDLAIEPRASSIVASLPFQLELLVADAVRHEFCAMLLRASEQSELAASRQL